MTHTSEEALESIDTKALMGLVVGALNRRFYSGMTSEEVSDQLGISLQSITPRFAPLERDGKIHRVVVERVKDKNRYKTRSGISGRSRIIWFATNHA